MGKWETSTVGLINQYKSKSVNPLNNPNRMFELYSVPSWDNNYPEIVMGKEIGSTKQTIEKDDVLICKINPRINRVWIVSQYSEYPLLASSEWIVVRNSQIDSSYLKRYFESPFFRDLLVSEQSGIGGSLTRAQPKRVNNYSVPLPPLSIQQQIADILDRASALIEKRKVQIAKLDLLVRARFVEMFGDPVMNPKGWEKVSIGDCLSDIIAGWSVDGEARNRRDNEIAVLKVSAVTQGVFDPNEYKVLDKTITIKKRVTPEKGDLLFSRANTRELVGATCIVNKGFPFLLLPDKLWKLKCKQTINIYYLKYTLSQKAIRNELSANATGTSGSMYNVSMDKLRSVSISLPSIKLQNEFADFVHSIESQKSLLQQSLAKMKLNYKSLVQKCFRGKMI